MDAWIANLADGSTKQEQWLPGYLSPWQRLMEYCKTNNTYITNLRLTMGSETRSCKANAVGYWQAHGMPAVQGVECDEELHKWRGIGWVEGETVQIIWGARDPATHQEVFWMETRSAVNQGQIIWGPKVELPTLDRSEAPVSNIREYSDKVLNG